jgi:ABC-type branched-subunit amino acid transport system substrate-binding protein
MMTAGLAALPVSQTGAGSALNNVARQSGGALGLAALSAVSTSQQAQFGAEEGALVQATKWTSNGGPVSAQTFAAMYGRYEYFSSQVLAHSYSNIFLILAVATAASGALVVFMRNPAKGGEVSGAAAGAH